MFKIKLRRNWIKKEYSSLCKCKSDEKIMDVEVAHTFFKRLVGLMFKKDIKNPILFEIPQGIKNGKIAKYRSSIHTCFMFKEIAIVFVDSENNVFEIAYLKPWRFFTPKKVARYILECDKNGFTEYNLKVGDKIEIKTK